MTILYNLLYMSPDGVTTVYHAATISGVVAGAGAVMAYDEIKSGIHRRRSKRQKTECNAISRYLLHGGTIAVL